MHPYDPLSMIAIGTYPAEALTAPDGTVIHRGVDDDDPVDPSTNVKTIDGKEYLCIPVKNETAEDKHERLMRENSVVKPEKVRWKIMDFDFVNAPLYERYLTDEDLWQCLDETVDDFNETPPMFMYPYTLADFPKKNLLLEGAALKAMKLTAMKEMRGEMQYDDGGIQSNLYYKTPMYSQVAGEMTQSYENSKRRIKKQMNLSRCFKGVW